MRLFRLLVSCRLIRRVCMFKGLWFVIWRFVGGRLRIVLVLGLRILLSLRIRCMGRGWRFGSQVLGW